MRFRPRVRVSLGNFQGMDVFQFNGYRDYVSARLKAMPGRGRGQFRKIAVHLRMHPTTISQIFKGDRNLSSEQAMGLAGYFKLHRDETEYWVLLSQLEQAQTSELKALLQRRIASLRVPAQQANPSSTPENERRLDLQEQALYYSHWHYGAVRLASFVPALQTLDGVSRHFNLPKSLLQQVVDTLVSCQLIEVEPGSGKIRPTVQRTELGLDSPFLGRHHQNWRIKALEKLGRQKPEELSYTCPMSISREDALAVRKILVDAVFQVSGVLAETQGEKLSCLTIDWFDL